MVQALYVLDLVEREIERSEFGECFETSDVRYKVVVQINLSERCGGIGRNIDSLYAVLSQAETL